MLRNIIGTIATRFIIALFVLAIILINARVLGPEKVGTISLLMLAITIIQLVNNFIGGGALVYLVPRKEIITLIIPSYSWAVITSVAGVGLMELTSLITFSSGAALQFIPEGFALHVMVLSLILSLSSVNFMFLIGQERIRMYNMVTVLQMVMLFGTLMVVFFILGSREVTSYLIGLYFSYSFAFLCSFFLILPRITRNYLGSIKDALKEIWRLGSVMQLGNILQFMNYRISYYFIDFFLNRASVGIYSVGVQLSESIWLSAKSISMVQYSRISNVKDEAYSARLTLNLLKVSMILTVLSLFMIMLVIHFFFPFILKPEFSSVPSIMMILAAGIIIFTVSINLSPYFSGTGKPVHNTIGSAIGLIMTLFFSLLFIPRMGLPGAAWAATIAYSLTAGYQLVVFLIMTRAKAKDFLLKRSDFVQVLEEVKKFLKK